MRCRKCKEKLKEVMTGDIFMGMLQANPSFCQNSKCDEFGYVTMVGYPEEASTNNKTQ